MLILTIETCTDTSTLGLVRDGAVIAEAAFPGRYTLARRMLLRLEWLLQECELSKADIEAVAVSLGPGSFTGVRIGAAVAKTLAQWRQIPLLGISTLEALAYPFRQCRHTLLAPIINARRAQAYLALFYSEGGMLLRQTADLVLSAEPLAALLHEHRGACCQTLLIGMTEGLPEAFQHHFTGSVAPVRSLVTPHALAALAQQRLTRGEQDDPMTLAPIYLRSPAD